MEAHPRELPALEGLHMGFLVPQLVTGLAWPQGLGRLGRAVEADHNHKMGRTEQSSVLARDNGGKAAPGPHPVGERQLPAYRI